MHFFKGDYKLTERPLWVCLFFAVACLLFIPALSISPVMFLRLGSPLNNYTLRLKTVMCKQTRASKHGERLYTYRYTVTTRMISALRWAAMRAILMFQ